MSSNSSNIVVSLKASDVIGLIHSVECTDVVTVPDTNQKAVLTELEALGSPRLVRAATEDDVLGICAGLWIAGRRPIALIQQLGLFASINALRAFTHDQHVPLAILTSLFGRNVQRAVTDDQPSAVQFCLPLLDAMEVRWTLVEGPPEIPSARATLASAFTERITAAVLLGAPVQ
jgi:sulfopyruvate decarboxylase TPP-binding subunit